MVIADDIKGWLKKPFDSSGSALNWVAFLGLLIIVSFFWQQVLISFFKEVREV